jgi:hypothetical protein
VTWVYSKARKPSLATQVPLHRVSKFENSHILFSMRAVLLSFIVLFSFVSVVCESYSGATSDYTKLCHPAESNAPVETSFDCCYGVPAKQNVEPLSKPILPLPLQQLTFATGYVFSALFANFHEVCTHTMLDRSPILRL